ncbi:hypothetical protein PIB30_005725 [Stylosanthes scabra]|uniref:Uncharacterized protein n=1 Tax=Stylosanthes scabra TaxID=79078 RepID=A0ABU6V2G1_9FABA|nr:hypothetical protein [Stylosanthes scabra]
MDDVGSSHRLWTYDRFYDLLIEFSTNLEQATQQAQQEGDDSAGTIDSNSVWRQTLSELCWNRVYGVGGFFASSLHRFGFGGSFAFAASTFTDPDATKVVDLREQVQNLTQSLETQGQQQHIDKVRSLKDTLAERDARAEEHLRRLEEMSRQVAAFYNPLRPGSCSATVGSSGSSTALPLPPRPPPCQPDHPPPDDDDDYEDA